MESVITKVSKDDIIALYDEFPEKQKTIWELGQDDIDFIAHEMEDAYIEGQFWNDLEIITEINFLKQHEKENT